jgi:tetratricopeptide (TPR) repeat protein
MVQDNRSLRRPAGAIIAVLLMAGCATSRMPAAPSASSPSETPPAQSAPVQPSPQPAPYPPAPPPARENRLSPATSSLVTQARAQAARGDLPAASATLDRALRIEPNNPLLWIELGKLRLVESDAHQAEICGRKALALASGDRRAQSQAGRLLADALRAQQRNQEALAVEKQPYMN